MTRSRSLSTQRQVERVDWHAEATAMATNRRPSPKGPRVLLGVVLIGAFMAAFDLFVVNIAVPTLGAEWHAGDAALELIVSGYTLGYGAGLVTGGRLGDRFGYRRVFILGLVAFTVASLLCGMAMTPTQLLLARLVQGVAAAAMVPQVLSLITLHVPAPNRGRATGWYGAISGLGALAGQIGGGALLQADLFGLGWRAVFLVNVPIGLLAAALALRTLPGGAAAHSTKFDPVGAAGAALTVALVLIPLALGKPTGWPWWTWASLAGSIPTAWLVVRWQRALAARGGAPIVNPTLFANRSYTKLLGATGCYQAYFASLLFTVSLLIQLALGAGPLRTAMVLLPQGLLFTLSSLLSGRAVARYGHVVIVAGAVTACLGLALIIAVLAAAGSALTSSLLAAPLALVGLGNGLLLPPVLGAALHQVSFDQAGAASGTLTTVQQLAGSLGVTVLGLAFFTIAGRALTSASTAMVTVGTIHIALVVTVITLVRTSDQPSGAYQVPG